MSMLDRLRNVFGPERAQYPWDSLYQSVLFNNIQYPLGLTQTISGTKEEIDSSFAGIVQGAYQSNGIVFAVELARLSLFSQARFVYQRMRNGEPGDTFSTRDLDILERPWPGGVTGDLLTSALLDHDLAGNAFIVRRDSDRGRLRRLRPDWITIVLGSFEDADVEAGDINADLLGYIYHPGGRYSGRTPTFLQRTEIAHFRGMPDPLASYRGMSWLTPVLREIESDSAATGHKLKFFENGATPNMIVSLDANIPPEQFKTFVQLFKEKEPVGLDVYKTLYLGGGADATVVGSNLRQMDFKTVQGAGESRIAAAGGVPPVIAGFSEGLQAATYSNYSQARRRFADLTVHPLWQNFCGSMQVVIPTPADAQLWYLDKHIAFLREDTKDRAEILNRQMLTIESGIRGGYEPKSVVAAVVSEDLSLLQHTGLYSVQLQPPLPEGPKPPPEPPEPPERAMLRQLERRLDATDRRADADARRADVAPVINVTTPPVTVNTPENPVTVTIERGAVEVSAPVTIEPAMVTVTTPAVRVENTVEPTPVEITVEPSSVEVRNEVTVEPTPVSVTNTVEPTPIEVTVAVPPAKSTTKHIVRDQKDRIVSITETTDGE